TYRWLSLDTHRVMSSAHTERAPMMLESPLMSAAVAIARVNRRLCVDIPRSLPRSAESVVSARRRYRPRNSSQDGCPPIPPEFCITIPQLTRYLSRQTSLDLRKTWGRPPCLPGQRGSGMAAQQARGACYEKGAEGSRVQGAEQEENGLGPRDPRTLGPFLTRLPGARAGKLGDGWAIRDRRLAFDVDRRRLSALRRRLGRHLDLQVLLRHPGVESRVEQDVGGHEALVRAEALGIADEF